MHRASELSELKSWPDPPDMQSATIKKVIRQAWKRAFGDVCEVCGCRMHFEIRFRSHRHYATIDHIEARSLGGTNSLNNIAVICRSCNGNKSIQEYRAMPMDSI